MKILYATTYIYDERWREFSRNKTGFGKMVNSIISSMNETENVMLVSHVITKGHDDWILKRTLFDVFSSIRIKDILQGIRWFFRWKQGLKARVQYFYYCVGKGYFAKKIKEIEPDLVHIHGIGFATKVFIEVCEELSLPYLVTLHGLIGIDSSVNISSWEKDYEKEFLIHARENDIPVSVISSGIKKRIEQYYLNGRIADNISVVLNGTNVPNNKCSDEYIDHEKLFDIVRFNTNYKNALEKDRVVPLIDIMEYIDFQKFNNKKILVYVGNITENKNQIQAVRCMNNILVLFGREFDNGEVRKLILKQNLNERVILAGFCDDLSEIWKRADINLFLSKNDGFGLPVIEGYMYGVPAVMFADLDAFEDIAFDAGMIPIPDRQDSEVISEIIRAVNKIWDKKLIRNYALQFSVSHMKETYIDVYKKCLNMKVNL